MTDVGYLVVHGLVESLSKMLEFSPKSEDMITCPDSGGCRAPVGISLLVPERMAHWTDARLEKLNQSTAGVAHSNPKFDTEAVAWRFGWFAANKL